MKRNQKQVELSILYRVKRRLIDLVPLVVVASDVDVDVGVGFCVLLGLLCVFSFVGFLLVWRRPISQPMFTLSLYLMHLIEHFWDSHLLSFSLISHPLTPVFSSLCSTWPYQTLQILLFRPLVNTTLDTWGPLLVLHDDS